MARVLPVSIVLIALAAGAAAAAAPTFDTTRLYSEATFAGAIKPYTDAIARNANDAEAHHWLGVAYLHAFRLYRLGFAPFAGGYGGKAVASLERSVQLQAAPAAMLALAEAYIVVGDGAKLAALLDRLVALTPPVTPK